MSKFVDSRVLKLYRMEQERKEANRQVEWNLSRWGCDIPHSKYKGRDRCPRCGSSPTR